MRQRSFRVDLRETLHGGLEKNRVGLIHLLFSAISDPGDGGFQGDRWTGGPAALRCDLESSTENSQHGVSISEETHADH